MSSFPDPIPLTHHFSRTTRNREASTVKKFYKYYQIPGIGQLAGGLPNTNYFPFDSLEAKTAFPDRWKPTPNSPIHQRVTESASAPHSSSLPSSHLVVPKTSRNQDVQHKIDIASALQYGTAEGYPPLHSFIRQFTLDHLHPNVPYKGGPEVILTCGSTDGFSKTLEAFNNIWNGDRDPIEEREGILVEHFCYMNAVQTAKPRGMNIIPVALDSEGMMPFGKGGLKDILENWDNSRGKRPHLMYTVTIGQNPTSGTLGVERRREIYDLCVKYDIIIIEDDPYWYLQFPSVAGRKGFSKPHGTKSSGFEFLDSLVPSYLSLDYEGRVVRLDTFSKTVAPGCRAGWITAQPMVIERLLRITESSTAQPSGFVQSMIAELIIGPQNGTDGGRGGAKDGRGWKMDGWVRWLEGLRGNYERRMTAMCDILEDGMDLVKTGRRGSLDALAIPTLEETGKRNSVDDEWSVVETTQIYTFERPRGGMFTWLCFDFTTHPLRKSVPLPRLSEALWVFWTKKPYRILAAPGAIFAATEDIKIKDSWKFFRLCFAACEEEELKPLSQRVVQGVHAFWRIKNKDIIDELLNSDEASMMNIDPSDMRTLMSVC